jgi:hypothetical protein
VLPPASLFPLWRVIWFGIGDALCPVPHLVPLLLADPVERAPSGSQGVGEPVSATSALTLGCARGVPSQFMATVVAGFPGALTPDRGPVSASLFGLRMERP